MAGNMNRIIPTVLATITGKPRYLPVIEWSQNSLSHNIFRAYELIFWRRYGIRAESATLPIVDSTNKVIGVVREFYTFESVVVHLEAAVRKLFSFKPISIPYRIYIPQLQLTNGMSIPASPYLFAIAFDAATAASSSTSPLTISHTSSGSDRMIVTSSVGAQGPTTTCTSITYSGASLTEITSVLDSVGTGHRTYMHYKTGQATGANNTVATYSSGSCSMGVVSYTGVNSTGQPDGFSTTAEATTTSYSQNVTVTASNCWVVATSRLASGATPSGSGGSAVRVNPELARAGGGSIWDSNGTVGTGTVTITVTSSSQLYGGGVAASFKPSGGAATVYPRMALLNVGQ